MVGVGGGPALAVAGIGGPALEEGPAAAGVGTRGTGGPFATVGIGGAGLP